MAAPKGQAFPWTHQETLHLIHAYQDKWYALQRGQLRSSQWEEIAANVAARCGYTGHLHPSKTAVQCRHKMEKLRQRFRAEKRRLSHATASPWPYFDLINNLLRGPLPISARPYEQHHKSIDSNSDENRSKSRSVSQILRNRNCSGENEEEEEEEEGQEMCWKVAAEIGLVAERLVGIESARMEMMKEAEMRRMAMEKKRIEMILDSEHKILSSISKAFGSPSPKRLKIGQHS
ncbi:trihelix transcription factor ASIL1 [Momordica charantia]|uniref:Trihelix transcription factor ASIL1 n=1 Tax=Momordica charantia TaxID=3673 RepID=A0A6J1CW89_MOMCH|nr:trihelix transcription factor ASIL1 [Momordica charantia]